LYFATFQTKTRRRAVFNGPKVAWHLWPTQAASKVPGVKTVHNGLNIGRPVAQVSAPASARGATPMQGQPMPMQAMPMGWREVSL
jgi:hypothetical protein